jgi:hypothetical protein
MLAPCPNPKLVDHPLSVVSECSFNIFPAIPPYLEAASSSCNLRTCHAMETRGLLNPIKGSISNFIPLLISLRIFHLIFNDVFDICHI